MRHLTITSLVTISVLLSACAGRQANPVQVVQNRDTSLSCSQLAGEVGANNKALSTLVAQNRKRKANNTASAVVGAVVFFPALFFLDLKGAAKEEAQALQSRNAGLVQRHKAKNCKPAIKTITVDEVEAQAKANKKKAKASNET